MDTVLLAVGLAAMVVAVTVPLVGFVLASIAHFKRRLK